MRHQVDSGNGSGNTLTQIFHKDETRHSRLENGYLVLVFFFAISKLSSAKATWVGTCA